MIRVLACLSSPRASPIVLSGSVHGAAGGRALLRSWLSDLPPHALEGEGVHPSATGNHAALHGHFLGGTTRVSHVGALNAARLLSPRCPGTRATGRRTPGSPKTSSSWRTCRDLRGFSLSPRPPPPRKMSRRSAARLRLGTMSPPTPPTATQNPGFLASCWRPHRGCCRHLTGVSFLVSVFLTPGEIK